MTVPNLRDKLRDIMRKTLDDEARNHTWTYHEVRPMPVPSSWQPGQKVQGDCSKGVQYLCKWAGVPDPMNNNYSDWGNSQTLWTNLQHIANPAQLEVGDVVTFGHDGDQHAAMVYEKGADPLLWSFGRQGAPNTYRLSQDSREHQLLRLPVPHYVPTPQDKLRAKTGWFSWMAWREGEGDWRTYKKADKRVRPNVPKMIPLGWWKRRAQFLLNRKKGNKPN